MTSDGTGHRWRDKPPAAPATSARAGQGVPTHGGRASSETRSTRCAARSVMRPSATGRTEPAPLPPQRGCRVGDPGLARAGHGPLPAAARAAKAYEPGGVPGPPATRTARGGVGAIHTAGTRRTCRRKNATVRRPRAAATPRPGTCGSGRARPGTGPTRPGRAARTSLTAGPCTCQRRAPCRPPRWSFPASITGDGYDGRDEGAYVRADADRRNRVRGKVERAGHGGGAPARTPLARTSTQGDRRLILRVTLHVAAVRDRGASSSRGSNWRGSGPPTPSR